MEKKFAHQFSFEELEGLEKTEPKKVEFINFIQHADNEGGFVGLIEHSGSHYYPDELKQQAELVAQELANLEAVARELMEKYNVWY